MIAQLRRALAAYRALPRENRRWEALVDACAWGIGVACSHLPAAPDDAERTERIKAGVMSRIAADYGEGQARRQNDMMHVAEDMATGARVTPAKRNGHHRGGND